MAARRHFQGVKIVPVPMTYSGCGMVRALVTACEGAYRTAKITPLVPEGKSSAVYGVLHGKTAVLALAVGDRAPWAPALDGLVLNVPAGGRVCVMGASGVGKSTLLALAAGECVLCSMVFQDARLIESVSALDNVLVCADARVDASSAAALLRLLVPGVDVHARVAELSGGQRRRVEIARALLCGGCAVILDEPFTGLDAAARDATAGVVLELLDGRTLLLATHDPIDAQALDISDVITLQILTQQQNDLFSVPMGSDVVFYLRGNT